MIIDEQIIQIKQFIKDAEKFIGVVKQAKPFSLQEQSKVKAVVAQLRFQERLLQKRCIYNSYKIERHCRNYSEPKFKQRSQYTNYRTFPEKSHTFQENLYKQPEQYFKNSMDDLEGQIIQLIVAQQSNYQSSLIIRLDTSRAILYCTMVISAIYTVGQNMINGIFCKKIMLPILKDRSFIFTHSQQLQLEFIFQDHHLRSNSPWFIRKSRNFKLRNLAKKLFICVEKDYIFDMAKLFEPSKYAPYLTVFFSPRIMNLARIKNIKPFASPAGANAGEFFEVEYQLGLKTVLELKDLKRKHKWAFEDYQQGLFS